MNHTPAPSPTLTTLGDIAFADCGEHPTRCFGSMPMCPQPMPWRMPRRCYI